MKRFTFLLFMSLWALTYAGSIYGNELRLYTSASLAHKHCSRDEVVWLNLPTGIWHDEGSRWYGKTKHGAYVCKNEAAKAGDRASLAG
jgi:hypothetical protein